MVVGKPWSSGKSGFTTSSKALNERPHALCHMPQNIEALQQAGAMALLRPLLLDNVPRCALDARCVVLRSQGARACSSSARARRPPCRRTVDCMEVQGSLHGHPKPRMRPPACAAFDCAGLLHELVCVRPRRRAPARAPHSIQQSAAMALGRLANYSDDLAEAVVQNEILPQLVRLLRAQGMSPKWGFKRADSPIAYCVCICCSPHTFTCNTSPFVVAEPSVDIPAFPLNAQAPPPSTHTDCRNVGGGAGRRRGARAAVPQTAPAPTRSTHTDCRNVPPPPTPHPPPPRLPASTELVLQVYSLSEQNRFYKKAAGYCLRAVAKHSPELAQAVVDSGALDSLVTCLEEFDPGVKVGRD